MNKIESFSIDGRGFTIEKLKNDSFLLRHSGCGIGTVSSMSEARKKIHTFAVERIKKEKEYLEKRLKTVETIQAQLGDDEFNLGRFLDASA